MRTKIVATIGPASCDREKLAQLAEAGVSVFRLNFSHGDPDFFRGVVSSIREIEKECGRPLTIMQDLPGPKIRIGILPEGRFELHRGDKLTLGRERREKEDLPFIPFDHPRILAALVPGDVLVLADGIIFTLLTITGLRRKIFDAIPSAVRMAIPAGIGLFIAFLGLQNAGLVVDSSTLVGLASFNLYSGTATWGSIMPMLVTFFALLAIAAMSRRGVKGSVLFGILGGAVAYYILGFTVPGFYDGFAESLSFNPFTAFSEFAQLSFGKVFTEGFNFTPYIEANGMGSFVIMFITTALAFCMVDMFDTLGTLYGACARGGLLTKEGEVPHIDRAMLADAIATTTGAICGTSTVTTFVESSAGVGEGGRAWPPCPRLCSSSSPCSSRPWHS